MPVFFIGLAMATKFSTLPIYLVYFVAQILAVIHNPNRRLAAAFHWIGSVFFSVLIMTAAHALLDTRS